MGEGQERGEERRDEKGKSVLPASQDPRAIEESTSDPHPEEQMCTLICTITICTCTCDTCMYSADMYSIDMYNHDTCACTMYVRTVTDVQLWHHIEQHQHSLHVHCPVLFSSRTSLQPQGGTCMYRHWRRGEGREERGWKGRGGEGEERGGREGESTFGHDVYE